GLVEVVVQQAADRAMREQVAFHQLAVGGPLLLELLERGGIHHRVARFELVDMDVDQSLLLTSRAQRSMSEANGALQTRDPGSFSARRKPGSRISGAPLRFAARCTASGTRSLL